MINLELLIEFFKSKPIDIYRKFSKEKLSTQKLITDYDNFMFIFTKRDIPCLVAHVDTWHNVLPKGIIYNRFSRKITSLDGLGADDRAGVYVLYKFLKSGKYNILLTNYEEVGGDGAIVCIDKIKDYLDLNDCFIQIDRKGRGEYVYYLEPEDEFQRILESTVFRLGNGVWSDVYILSSETKIAHANFSCGYYNNHTKNEFLLLDDLEMVLSLLSNDSFYRKIDARKYFIKKEQYSMNDIFSRFRMKK